MENMANIPVPYDIPLDMPLPEWLLVVLLIVSFLLHILFVNLMLGGTFLTFWFERKGRDNSDYIRLAQEIGKTITVNKSLAVVLGVAPLLSINALYTVYFYSANALTGIYWISLVPLVTVIFLLLYWHKYSWKKYENRRTFHLSLIGIASVMFLFVPLIFLTNINLMLFPEQWANVKGFWDAAFLWNVIPRYLHFVTASFAVTGLFLFGYFRRKNSNLNEILENSSREEVLTKFYKIALHASLAQLVFGPLVFFTLPWDGVTWGLAHTIITGIVFALAAMFFMWKDIRTKVLDGGKHFGKVVIALTVTVMLMGTGRHVYRATVLGPHKQAMAEKTENYIREAKQAARRAEALSNIETMELKIDKELDRFTRRALYKIYEGNTAIKDIKFDLARQLIIFKYEKTKISGSDIIGLVNNKEFKVKSELSRN